MRHDCGGGGGGGRNSRVAVCGRYGKGSTYFFIIIFARRYLLRDNATARPVGKRARFLRKTLDDDAARTERSFLAPGQRPKT